MKFVKKLLFIFFLGFIFNLVWENLHHYFYIHYQGREITQIILIKAALFDAFFITLMGALFIKIYYLKQRLWLAIIIGIIFAILLEHYALLTNRWAYTSAMPIIPLIKTGLTPTIQLGLLSYLIYRLAGIKK